MGKFSFLLFLLVSILVSQCFARSLVKHQNPDIKPDCDCPIDPPHGGGSGSGGNPTPIPTPTPSHGGGGYYHSPPTSPIVVPPVHPTPSAPSHPTPYHPTPSHPTPSHPTPSHPTPSTPSHPVSPTPVSPTVPTPSTPVSPTVPTPSTPAIPDPHFPPFFPGTCTYWSTHPGAIFAIFGYLGNIGHSFGSACASAFGSHNLTFPDALTNTQPDGIGALYREGTAALLNSLSCNVYPFTAQQVKDAFSAAVVSERAAAHQAKIFRSANEGKMN